MAIPVTSFRRESLSAFRAFNAAICPCCPRWICASLLRDGAQGRGGGRPPPPQGCIRRGKGGLAGTPLLLGYPSGPRRRRAKVF